MVGRCRCSTIIRVAFSVEEAERFVPFLADAIAVALGYTTHPNGDAAEPLLKQPEPRPVRTKWHLAESVSLAGRKLRRR